MELFKSAKSEEMNNHEVIKKNYNTKKIITCVKNLTI